MNFIKNALLFLLFTSLFWSCNSSSFQKTESGLKYKFINQGNGDFFKNGEFIFFFMDYYDETDSLLFTYRTKGIPVTLQYFDSIWDYRGQLYEGMKMMRLGDSAIFKVKCSNLFEVSFKGNIPYALNPNSEITFYIGVEQAMTKEQFAFWRAEMMQKKKEETDKKIEQQLFEELSIIDEITQESGIIPLELESGIRYIINKEERGTTCQEGDVVSVKYTGKLLDGTVFESFGENNDPFEFIVGSNRVIDGLNEGVQLMSEGDKYTFYIPSSLAYGISSYKDIVKPLSILVYEIDLLEINKKEN